MKSISKFVQPLQHLEKSSSQPTDHKGQDRDSHLTWKAKAETLIWLERTRKRHSSDWKGQGRDTHLTGKDTTETLIQPETTCQWHLCDGKGQDGDIYLTWNDKAETLIQPEKDKTKTLMRLKKMIQRRSSDWKGRDRTTVNQTNLATVSKATLAKLLRDGVEQRRPFQITHTQPFWTAPKRHPPRVAQARQEELWWQTGFLKSSEVGLVGTMGGSGGVGGVGGGRGAANMNRCLGAGVSRTKE